MGGNLVRIECDVLFSSQRSGYSKTQKKREIGMQEGKIVSFWQTYITY
jgi:hypothetical protein